MAATAAKPRWYRLTPDRLAIGLLSIEFLVISVLGCCFIYGFWLRTSPLLGLIRCIAFVVIMGAIHLVGYHAWKRQRVSIPAQTDTQPSIWKAYGEPIKIAVVQQVVILFLAALVLDGGVMLRIATVAAAGSWAFNIVIVARRPRSPTPTDVLIVKYGFWLSGTCLVRPGTDHGKDVLSCHGIKGVDLQ